MTFWSNPVLRGSRADPSICRMGEEYVLVTSSFSYFPGIPVHRSRDLVQWQLTSHVLTEDDLLPVPGLDVSDGVWAPTIRHHDGRLFVVYTITIGSKQHRTFVAVSGDPAGPWERPVELDGDGFDPSLLFASDGRAWFTACRESTTAGEGPGEIWLQQFDPDTLSLVGPRRAIWHGAMNRAWVEAPHLYQRDDGYVLLAAEGGTERMHAVTSATADDVWGPYRTDPRNPLLTHRHLGEQAEVQNVGHADVVEAVDGRTWAITLGVRVPHGFHTTGREAFLVPAAWEDGRLVLSPGVGVVPAEIEMDTVIEAGDRTLEWVSLGGPVAAKITGPDVRLDPAPATIAGVGRPALLLLRQDEPAFWFAAVVTDWDRATTPGIAVFHTRERFVSVVVEATPAGSVVVSGVLRIDGRDDALGRLEIPAGPVWLWAESDGRRYRFGVGTDFLGEVDAALFGTENVGGFVGTMLGLTCTGPETAGPAHFGDVTYRR